MTKGKKSKAGTGKPRPLKLKKETIRDLDPKGKAGRVKGGATIQTCWNCVDTQYTCTCATQCVTKCGAQSCYAACGVGGFHG